jgi:hypothetical protein
MGSSNYIQQLRNGKVSENKTSVLRVLKGMNKVCIQMQNQIHKNGKSLVIKKKKKKDGIQQRV